MYAIVLILHSLLRWAILIGLLCGIATSTTGLIRKRPYSNLDNTVRMLVVTISHIQLLMGLILYFTLSPITQHFLEKGSEGNDPIWFFGIYHIFMMILAVTVITIGSSFAKRADIASAKFKAILLSYFVALLVILSGIPWFRPYFRFF